MIVSGRVIRTRKRHGKPKEELSFPLNYNDSLLFHGADTGSTPVREAKYSQPPIAGSGARIECTVDNQMASVVAKIAALKSGVADQRDRTVAVAALASGVLRRDGNYQIRVGGYRKAVVKMKLNPNVNSSVRRIDGAVRLVHHSDCRSCCRLREWNTALQR